MDSYFDKIQRGKCSLYIHRDFRNDAFERALLDGEEKLTECYRMTLIPSSKFARIYKLTVRFDNVDKLVYLKRYLRRSIWDFVKDFVRAGRAEREFKAAGMLCENGFDPPAIIAIGKSGHGLFRTANFMATLEIEHAKQIERHVCDDGLGIRGKREIIRAFGQTIGKMHARGIFHGDLRLGNVLAKQEQGRWRFFFVDNERTRKFHRLPGRLRLKNLVQINMYQPPLISNTDRMRFFREYWLQNENSNIEKKILTKKVLKKTTRRLRKKMKTGL